MARQLIFGRGGDGATQSGAFSISATEKIVFSPGNLQYQASTGTWRFAEHQYDAIGDANSNISASYSGWIDLFGWGTGNNPTNNSTEYSDYSTFVDWGTNAILNGSKTDAVNTWRTLSSAEWYYIFFSRTNAANLFGQGSVSGVNGLVVLPDNWTIPAGLTFTASTTQGLAWNGLYYYDEGGDHYTDNTYSAAQWEQMEANGAVFLPSAGGRLGINAGDLGWYGVYWSSTPKLTDRAYGMSFEQDDHNPQFHQLRYYGVSVRLVRTAPASGSAPAGVEMVDLGLSVMWANRNVGATNGATAESWYGDYFAWGETAAKSEYNWSTYTLCNGSETTLTKYCVSSSNGTLDNKTILEPVDDAAAANWGGSWRMPTHAELQELCNTRSNANYSWVWQTDYSGVSGLNGWLVTYTTNGKSIFLPAAGYRSNSSLFNAGSIGDYWSASLDESYSLHAWIFGFSSSNVVASSVDGRYDGQSVRPVCP